MGKIGRGFWWQGIQMVDTFGTVPVRYRYRHTTSSHHRVCTRTVTKNLNAAQDIFQLQYMVSNKRLLVFFNLLRIHMCVLYPGTRVPVSIFIFIFIYLLHMSPWTLPTYVLTKLPCHHSCIQTLQPACENLNQS
jgi:hypothetical protein